MAQRRFNKLFCIGAGKTGTKTIAQVLRQMGVEVAPQRIAEHELVRPTLRGDLDPLKAFVERHEAFQDMPFAHGQVYAQLDALFPGSKFILTIREPKAWFSSLKRFSNLAAEQIGLTELTQETMEACDVPYPGAVAEVFQSMALTTMGPRGRVVTQWDKMFDEATFIQAYRQRNIAIARHFLLRPDDLLIIDVTQEPDVSRILKFLGLGAERNFAMPHLHKTDDLAAELAVQRQGGTAG